MKKKKKVNNIVKLPWHVLALILLLLFLCLSYRIINLATSEVVGNTNLQKFAKQRTSKKETLVAKRGNIYDVNGNPIAQNVSSYTLIAYLDPERTINPDKPAHVVDKEETAAKLAPVLEMEEETILKHLNKRETNPKIKQTEFGTKGKGLTELKKDEILALGLKGIDFIETQKRYYPYGDFLSYTVGYVRERAHPDDPNKTILVGEMGLEKYYDKELTGEDGFLEYQKDRQGYKIAGTKEFRTDAKDGQDIYLTIDVNIQLQIEKAIHKSKSESRWDWMSLIVADAKTGEIIGLSSDPSFDPNKRNMTNYLNYAHEVLYEPGSTHKIFTYMAALEKGIYDEAATYKTGSYITKDGTEIRDWNRSGWGNITYDQGFALSSNTGVINLIKRGLTAEDLKSYYQLLGFGSQTGIELPNEAKGKLNFKYETEILNAGFGQGITTTAIQNIKAMTSITNGGKVLTPYLVSKIADHNNQTVYEAEKKESAVVASASTIKKMKELLTQAIEGDSSNSTAYPYRMDGYGFVAKTGTAQVALPVGGYSSGNIIKSILGFYPVDDPEVIIYLAIKNPRDRQTGGDVKPLKTIIQDIVANSANYLNIQTDKENINYYQETKALASLVNRNTKDVEEELTKQNIKTIILGNGNKIIKQYPNRGIKISSKDPVILLTNDLQLKVPNFKGLSYKESFVITNFLNLDVSFEGSGFVSSQSLKVGTLIDDQSKLVLTLSSKI